MSDIDKAGDRLHINNLDEQDEFQRIMNETYTNNDYCDEEIADLVLMPVKTMVSDQLSRSDSNQSFDQPLIVPLDNEEEINYEPQHVPASPPIEEKNLTILQTIEQQQLANYAPAPYSAVQKKYSLHLLKHSQRLNLSDNSVAHVPAHINSYLRKNRKTVVGAQVFFENQERTFLLWTNEGEVLVFYPLSLKCSVVRPFDNGITTAKICPQLQFLMVASNSLELAVYRLRQPISIEGKKSFRFLSQPSLLHSVGSKHLKCNILHVEFIPSSEDGVVQFVAVDEFDEVSIHTCKKKLLGYRSQIELLPLVFESVFMIKLTTFALETADSTEEPQSATVLAISSQQAITLCLINPHFQLLFVYHQSNRESVVKQGRLAHIDFHNNRLLIVWDKYLEIVGIDLLQLKPAQFNIRTLSHFFLAENSLAVGFLSDTLIYQFSRSGLRVYSVNRFRNGSGSGASQYQGELVSAQIYFRDLSLEGFPEASKLTSDLLINAQPPVSELKRLACSMSTTIRNRLYSRFVNHNSLVFIHNNQLESLQFVPYSQYLNKVDSEGHWKLCLSILKGVYEGTICELDCIQIRVGEQDLTSPEMKKIKIECQENVERYLERLFTLVSQQNKSANWNQRDIESQELLFLCDFLIRTGNSRFMMEEVAGRCTVRGLPFFESLEPFILLKRVNDIGCANIELTFQRYSNEVLSKLVYSLDLELNAMHIIKSLLLRKSMLQQFLYISVHEEDYYTPFVVLVARYQENHDLSAVHLLLYYLKKCFRGQTIPNGSHQKSTHKLILKEIVLRVLLPPIYQLLIDQTHAILFEQVLPQLFSERCLPQLNDLENDSELISYFRENDLEADIIRNLVVRRLPIPGEEDTWFGHYQRFILDLFVRSLLVDYPIINGLSVALHRNELSIQLVNKVLEIPEFDRQLNQYSQLDSFLESLVGTDYVELRIKLLLLKKKEVEATRLLLSSSRINHKIFEHLRQILPSLPGSELNAMSLLLKEEIRLLAELDISQLQEILTCYFAQQQNVFIGVLEPYPKMQLDLISAILGNSREDKDLRIRYLQLMTRLRMFRQVEAEIFKDLYPLDESIEICREFGLHRAEAYLYERLGDVNRSIRMHFVVINEQLAELENEWSDTREVLQSKISQLLDRLVDICLRICRNVSQRGEEECQMHWFVIVEELERLKQVSRNHYLQLRSVINSSVYPRVFQQIITNVELHSIIRYIEQNLQRLEFNTVRDSFILLVKAYSYEKEMLFKCRDMMLESVDDTRDKLLLEYRRGFGTTGICSLCSGDEDLLIRYPCHHQIHPYCTKDIKICCICALEDESFQITQTVMKQEIGQFNLLKSDSRIEPLRLSRKPRRNILIDWDFQTEQLTEGMKQQLQRS